MDSRTGRSAGSPSDRHRPRALIAIAREPESAAGREGESARTPVHPPIGFRFSRPFEPSARSRHRNPPPIGFRESGSSCLREPSARTPIQPAIGTLRPDSPERALSAIAADWRMSVPDSRPSRPGWIVALPVRHAPRRWPVAPFRAGRKAS